MKTACVKCGAIRNYRPATAAKLKTALCWSCFTEMKAATWRTFTCPHCGRERVLPPGEAGKRKGQTCFHCPRYAPAKMPETYDAGYVVGAVIGDGSLRRIETGKSQFGYYIYLGVTDSSFAERFRRHLQKCVRRTPWMVARKVTKKANPSLSIPGQTITEWRVGVGSRQWYDRIKPYKLDRRYDDLHERSEQFRRGFFQGILDAEGYVNPKYTDIANSDMELLAAVKKVLESLGERAAVYGPYPYSRGVAHLRTRAGFKKTRS
jgi:hypothetical protein